jgi:hypothetical protein
MGVLNCYATCISQVTSVFRNEYFSRVWTFQEMILGKNILMWGVNKKTINEIGQFDTWMDLATDSKDKALKLRQWIEAPRYLKPNAVNAVLRVIEDDIVTLTFLQTQVEGIQSARTDIVNGGPTWWYDNHKGVSNIFSAVSILPRECDPTKKEDVFKGMLGIFSGLFTAAEMMHKLGKGKTLDELSFAFFQQLSLRTRCAWTKLSISSGDRGEWDWIPVVPNVDRPLTTDCFSGVVNLGRAKENGLVKTTAVTGLIGVPRPYMKISINRGGGAFQFSFQGCNCGKKVKLGRLKKENIPTKAHPHDIMNDATGRTLVQCATILGSLLDPGNDVVEYRRKLLGKLRPVWRLTDPTAKPAGWIDRCVSGTPWENPHLEHIKVHNCSMMFRFPDITDFRSRLYNKNTANLVCHVRTSCGCTIEGPFAMIFEALTAVHGSYLGDITAELDNDNRIMLTDGLGLVQVGDVGKSFNVVAFGGDLGAHKTYASSCRSTKKSKPAAFGTLQWPTGRAIVNDAFSHGISDVGRSYGYVETQGIGNLLICRWHPMGKYKIIGVCIDEAMANKKGSVSIVIR